MSRNPRPDRDLLRRCHHDHRGGGRAVGADPAALDDVLAADRQGVGQAAGGDPGPLQRGSSRPRPAAPRARGPDRQDAAEPQEQREERLAMAGAGKGHSRARGALDAAWEELRAKIRDGLARSRLSSFMRFCSANNITPAEVDETVVDRFMELSFANRDTFR